MRKDLITKLNKDIKQAKVTGKISTRKISDGYHTFGELYEQRAKLFCALCNAYPEKAWKTLKHNDEENDPMYEGDFLAGLETSTGTISYHIKLKHWNEFLIPEIPQGPKYDGKDTPERILKRLTSLNTGEGQYSVNIDDIIRALSKYEINFNHKPGEEENFWLEELTGLNYLECKSFSTRYQGGRISKYFDYIIIPINESKTYVFIDIEEESTFHLLQFEDLVDFYEELETVALEQATFDMKVEGIDYLVTPLPMDPELRVQFRDGEELKEIPGIVASTNQQFIKQIGKYPIKQNNIPRR